VLMSFNHDDVTALFPKRTAGNVMRTEPFRLSFFVITIQRNTEKLSQRWVAA
jgi:hypothetical protein